MNHNVLVITWILSELNYLVKRQIHLGSIKNSKYMFIKETSKA